MIVHCIAMSHLIHSAVKGSLSLAVMSKTGIDDPRYMCLCVCVCLLSVLWSGGKISGSGIKISLVLIGSAPDNCLKCLYGMYTPLNNTAKVPVAPQKSCARRQSCTVGDILFPPTLNFFFFLPLGLSW